MRNSKGCATAGATSTTWLERLDLSKWADRKVETLSKGMSQKVQFIATVVAQPNLIVLDEPFSGLDPVNMEVLKDAIVSLRDKGSTVIFSTHDMDVAERMCDTIFMIFRGQKVLDGTLESIQAQYGNDTLRIRMHAVNGGLSQSAGRGAHQRIRPLQGTAHGARRRSAADSPRSCWRWDRSSISRLRPAFPARHLRANCRPRSHETEEEPAHV